jgi:hypothetical protein
VDQAKASALVLPSLVALGPPLDLERLRSPYYQDKSPSRLDDFARFGQMMLATVIGLVMLALPMLVLGWAASEVYSIVQTGQDGPGVQDTYVPKGSVLDPAYRAPAR